MTLHGVDIFIWADKLPEVSREHGKFSLQLISNRGTRVYPEPSPKIELSNWHQCRYMSESEVSDQEVDALVSHLSERGYRWTKCQKLFKKDGVDQFSQPY